ncbi:6-phosphogluconate dehydrogenase, decarboxylating [Paecilomyces variotii No. 5]|uniref:6-phosphogluconate dehydrogenase, decarboxylating n=1 Tax=Byssochlamys spectabilis (strain No. 5 / NBRC 109023) TaxID=1356009 RepID=V5FSZ4_BYSSN|nr:6-phosphogluconate dehydrogenase, decarboxylating [Paecilomyces variotii No. 5]
MTDPISKFKRIGVVGAGNMGSMMTLAFAELGLDVSVWDVKKENVDQILGYAKGAKTSKGKVDGFYDINKFVKSLDVAPRKLFMFSITHGNPADSVLSMIKPDLKRGDIILDGGNENYRRTERRQRELEPLGVSWIGMGVSGGYQSARRGPSLSPGGDRKAIEDVLPFLEMYAAKDRRTGLPCVTYIGPGGAGHFVKMIHNGIEGGMLSTVCEAWALLNQGLGLQYEKIGDIFEEWNSHGEMKETYLIQIGSDICRTKKTPKGDYHGEGKSEANGYVLDDVLDKVVQDDDGTEGTPFWTIMDTAARHVAAPTLATGHYFRVASGNREERIKVAQKLGIPKPSPLSAVKDKAKFIETLRRAVYCSFLASFCQGLEVIANASDAEGWNIDMGKCIQIWRAGCIIQEEYIADLLQPVLSNCKTTIRNIKQIDGVAAELHRNYDSLKQVVMMATEGDHYIPAMSATLEYLKYCGGTMLPTKFMEAEMDFFGAHAYDKPGVPGEDPGKVAKGAHHYEWRPAM